MATVSISEAARLTGKNRKTIQRYVADGRISMSHDVAGKSTIDISELIRVFGPLSQGGAATGSEIKGQHVASHGTEDIPANEMRIRVLEAELAARDEVIKAQQSNLDDLRQAMRLLEGPKARPWWKFGR